nr:hypothetical protein [Pseudomonadota bacterium]
MTDQNDVDVYLGPYEQWLYFDGKAYAFPQIRQFQSGFLTGLIEWDQPVSPVPRNSEEGVAVPTVWNGEGHFQSRFLPVVRAFENMSFEDAIRDLEQFAREEHPQSVSGCPFPRLRVNYPLPIATLRPGYDPAYNDHWSPDPATLAYLDRQPAGKRRLSIVGVIEDGIPFAHRHFRTLSRRETRIEYCWLQSARGAFSFLTWPYPRFLPETVLFGKEYSRDLINQLIENFGEDEDVLYERADAVDVLQDLGNAIFRHTSHGSCVMDIAVGYDADETPPEDIRIIAVQLPNTTAWDTSGFGKDMFMLSAFHYIFERADRLKKAYQLDECPLIVNFSYGFSAGPHDAGAGPRHGIELETAIDEMVECRRTKCQQPTAVVIPSGNSFQDRLHAVIEGDRLSQKGAKFDLLWRLQPNDRTPNYLEIWFPETTNDGDFNISLFAPDGSLANMQVFIPISKQLKTSSHGDARDVDGVFDHKLRKIGQISADTFRGTRKRLLICLAPTEVQVNPGNVSAPPAADAGLWKVSIERNRDEALSEPVLAWIQRDDDPEFLKSGGRQSYFDMPDYRRFDDEGKLKDNDRIAIAQSAESVVRRFGTLNGVATGKTTTVIAGYRGTSGNGYRVSKGVPVDYSSAGPSEDSRGNFDKSVSACGLVEFGSATPGIIAIGTRSGALGRLIGTSIAAPQAARQLARSFADGLGLPGQSPIDNYASLLTGEDVSGSLLDDVTYPSIRLGQVFVNIVSPVSDQG